MVPVGDRSPGSPVSHAHEDFQGWSLLGTVTLTLGAAPPLAGLRAECRLVLTAGSSILGCHPLLGWGGEWLWDPRLVVCVFRGCLSMGVSVSGCLSL